MTKRSKQLSNPFSTGGGGPRFEAQVQASFVALMLSGGFAPCLPNWPIAKIKLQSKFLGFDTDDLIVFVVNPADQESRKLLVQVKHSVSITERDATFGEVIQAAWNDFGNPKLFTRGRDAIALVTGPLSATDIDDVRPILERAKHMEDSKEFFGSATLAFFSSKSQLKKLSAIRSHLKRANNGVEVSDATTFEFLKHFHLLGYDLDIKSGVTLSLLHSIIGTNARGSAQGIWAQIVEDVQSTNQNAGTITRHSVSELLRAAFTPEVVQTIPTELATPIAPAPTQSLASTQPPPELAVAMLIGSWNEGSPHDLAAVEKVARREYAEWIKALREFLQVEGRFISLKDGRWWIQDRALAWDALGSKVFDDDLAGLKSVVTEVLSRDDSRLDVPLAEWDPFSGNDQSTIHSPELRKGLAETLALLGSRHRDLTRCSTGKAEAAAFSVVRELLRDATWRRWASLSEILPLLAEASPEEFLDAVELGLAKEPGLFDEVLAREGGELMGRVDMTGLLWALESLAWDERHFTRAIVCLGELSMRDPRGEWAISPQNSLVKILLPWLPQTLASVEKRVAAVRTLASEQPSVGWRLLKSLLPNATSTSSGTHKPVFRLPAVNDDRKGVTHEEYWAQIEVYSDLAIELATNHSERLSALIDDIPDLPHSSRSKLIDHLASTVVSTLPGADKLRVWTELVDLVTKHRRFHEAAWALKPEQVDRLAIVAESLAPVSPTLRHQRLFRERDFDLYEANGDYDVQRQQLDARRQHAIEEIVVQGGPEAVIDFAAAVESPWRVGAAYGVLAEEKDVEQVLPHLLDSGDRKMATLAAGFIAGRFRSRQWTWVESLGFVGWSKVQIGLFLSELPFCPNAWDLATRLLGDDEHEYWSRGNAYFYDAKGDQAVAVDKLLQHGRPNAALGLLHGMAEEKQSFDTEQLVRALLAAVSSTEKDSDFDAYRTVELIKRLQCDASVDRKSVAQVEWAYLALLSRDREAAPKTLERQLADDPAFFCKVLRTIYRSTKDGADVAEATTEAQIIAGNAYRLLSDWSVPPGLAEDGTFDGCQRPPQWRHSRIGIKAPLHDRHNGATSGSA